MKRSHKFIGSILFSESKIDKQSYCSKDKDNESRSNSSNKSSAAVSEFLSVFAIE